jgi:hypothetical protein
MGPRIQSERRIVGRLNTQQKTIDGLREGPHRLQSDESDGFALVTQLARPDRR